LYYSPKINRLITSMRIRWVEHTASIGNGRNAYKILAGKT